MSLSVIRVYLPDDIQVIRVTTESDVRLVQVGVENPVKTIKVKGDQGEDGEPGAQIFVQIGEPATDEPEGSVWIDSDSANQDVYQLEDGVWVDTGLKLINDPSAENVTFTPSGDIEATDVQAAIEELDAEKQPLDSDLTDIAALATTAYGRSLLTLADDDALAAEISEFYQPLDADLTALAGLGDAGIIARTGSGTVAARTITGTPNEVTVSSGDGVSGNPVIGLPDDVTVNSVTVADEAYDESGWNGDLSVPTKNAVRDKIETLQPLDSDLTSWAGVTRASGFDTFAATPSSANLRGLLSDESGTGNAYFQGGDLGTPSAGVLTNATGLTASGVASATLVTAADTVASNDNDTTWPTTAALIDYAQPLDSDLTSIAALTTTAAGRSVLTVADDNMDELVVWDDSAGTMKTMPLADFTTEASPASGDYIIIVGAEGDVRKANWSTLPGSGGLPGDPGADRVLIWDDSNTGNETTWGTLTAPLAISGTALVVGAASDSASGVTEYADATEMEAGSATNRAVTPGLLHRHPAVSKCRGQVNNATTVVESVNITSVADNAAGDKTWTIGTDFSNANWQCLAGCNDSAQSGLTNIYAKAVGTCSTFTYEPFYAAAGIDPDNSQTWIVGFGDQ